MTTTEPTDLEPTEVRLPSGGTVVVLTDDEADYLRQRVRLYHDEYRFTNVSDLQEVDRICLFEMLCHRWAAFLLAGSDYFGSAIDEASLRRELDSYSTEIRQMKKTLGIDKVARDRAKGDGSVAQYWSNLLTRAKAFGIHRNNQAARAMELINELLGMVTFNRNADADEQREFEMTDADILNWVHTTMRAEYDELDVVFRREVQRYWQQGEST